MGKDKDGNAIYGQIPTVSSSTDTIYTRQVTLLIDRRDPFDPQKSTRVYEGKAVSRGSCASVAGVMDAILDAIFKDFPGESGATRTINIDWDGSC